MKLCLKRGRLSEIHETSSSNQSKTHVNHTNKLQPVFFQNRDNQRWRRERRMRNHRLHAILGVLAFHVAQSTAHAVHVRSHDPSYNCTLICSGLFWVLSSTLAKPPWPFERQDGVTDNAVAPGSDEYLVQILFICALSKNRKNEYITRILYVIVRMSHQPNRRFCMILKIDSDNFPKMSSTSWVL